MKRILIVRSVSLQQLDLVMGQICDQFKADEIDLLTPPHNHSHCEKYKDVTRIIDYPAKTSYSCFTIPKEVKKEKYDAVIVPVSNLKGTGFLNVLMLALRLKTKSIYTCNLATDIKKISKFRILLKATLSYIAIPIAAILTLITIIPTTITLLLTLKTPKDKT